jgi:hypothetical protein
MGSDEQEENKHGETRRQSLPRTILEVAMIRRWSTINIGWRIAVVTIVAAIILPVAWYLGSPLFINVTVNERFPDAMPLAATTNAPTAQPTATAAPAPTAALDVSSA